MCVAVERGTESIWGCRGVEGGCVRSKVEKGVEKTFLESAWVAAGI